MWSHFVQSRLYCCIVVLCCLCGLVYVALIIDDFRFPLSAFQNNLYEYILDLQLSRR